MENRLTDQPSTALSYDSLYNPPETYLPPPPPPDGEHNFNYTDNPPARLVLFLGGCTMAEIAAVRVLARKQINNKRQGTVQHYSITVHALLFADLEYANIIVND